MTGKYYMFASSYDIVPILCRTEPSWLSHQLPSEDERNPITRTFNP